MSDENQSLEIAVLPKEIGDKILSEYKTLEEALGDFHVRSEEDYGKAGETLILVKKRLDRIDELDEQWNGGLKKALKEQQARFRFFAEPFKKINEFLRLEMNNWNRKKALAQQEEERIKREEQKKLMAEAAKGDQEAAKKAVEIEPAKENLPEKKVVTEAGAVNTQKHWTFDVTDLSKVPLEFMVVDTKKVNAAIKTGVREIEGINIYETEAVRVTN